MELVQQRVNGTMTLWGYFFAKYMGLFFFMVLNQFRTSCGLSNTRALGSKVSEYSWQMEGMGGGRVDVNRNDPAFVLWTFGAISMENGLSNLMVLLQTSTGVSGSNSAIFSHRQSALRHVGPMFPCRFHSPFKVMTVKPRFLVDFRHWTIILYIKY